MKKTTAKLLPRLLAVTLCACTLGACATADSKRVTPLKKKEPEYRVASTQTGVASFYGGRWIGRKTANGERYRAQDVTAAHRKLPFNTMVRVTNLRNGKSTIVRINNRGPYVRRRIIDLSVCAAREIDMIGAGLAKVKLEVLEEKPSKPAR